MFFMPFISTSIYGFRSYIPALRIFCLDLYTLPKLTYHGTVPYKERVQAFEDDYLEVLALEQLARGSIFTSTLDSGVYLRFETYHFQSLSLQFLWSWDSLHLPPPPLPPQRSSAIRPHLTTIHTHICPLCHISLFRTRWRGRTRDRGAGKRHAPTHNRG